ncbi:TIGR01906 family membrane protein [Nesterenkonia lutea]|uniref:Integral membrane protein (TIGR01906 family) n=1 Tax=Nesterenkonia lutea TaxID=272919 RepID=A0ABR9JBT1_9MICC|nr:TIGR01906 family membrane protein [Nesterenkonia lutea]MBE1523389.1 integral membrane protein (TIGR01906 family) [Nesterenkonia lutea]
MSANSERNEAGRPADDNDDFESGLDYGAFASEEPDFPEDTLSAEREQRPAQQSAPAPADQRSDDQATQAIPAAREQQAAPGRHDQANDDDATQNIPAQRAPQDTAAESPNATRSLDDVRTTREPRSIEDTTTFTGAAAAGTPVAGGTAAGAGRTSGAPADASRNTPGPTSATNDPADTRQPTENAAELSRREQRRRDRNEAASDDQDTAVVSTATGGGATAVSGAAAAAGAGAGAATGTAAGAGAAAGVGSVDHSRRHAASPSHAVYGSDESITNEDLDEEVSRSKRGVSRFFQVLIAIFTPILLLVAAVRLVASPLFLWVAYNRPWIPEGAYSMDEGDRMVYGSYGTDFLTNLANSRYLAELAPGGEPLFTEAEVSHMVDVKFVVLWAMLIGLALLIITLILALLLRAWRPGGVARGLFAGAWVTLGIIIIVAVLAIIDWQFFFAEFHRIFFSDGTWTFPADSTLIQLYPEQFWIDAGIAVVALAVLFSVILLIATWPTKRRRARRAARLAEVHERRKAKLVDELNQGNGDYHDEPTRTRDQDRGRKRGRDRDRDQTTTAVG